MPPKAKASRQRKADALDEPCTESKPAIRISPVDDFNRPTASLGHNEVLCHKKKMRDPVTKELFVVPVITIEHWPEAIDWTASRQKAEDGLPVSPRTVATYEQMNAVEHKRWRLWEDRMLEKDPRRLDPNDMIAFHPGILKMYGLRQVP